jgi:hypothetical protein
MLNSPQETRVMDGQLFSTAVLQRLPLGESVWRVLHYTMDDSWLEDLWNRNRGRCFERELKFGTLARLVSDALLQHDGSGRKSFERAQEEGILNVSIPSPYAKLATLPVALSEAFLEEGSQRMRALLPEKLAVDPLPPCFAGYEVFGTDGKAVKHVKRLLKPLRDLQAGILGARASVGLDLRVGLVVGMVGHLDGEAGEAALTEELLPHLAGAAAPSGKPWIAVLDRLYCNLSFPQRVRDAGGHFLIRYCSNTTFVPDAQRPAETSHDSSERRIVQEWGWLGKVETNRRVYVRRITLDLSGAKSIGVVTDLWDEEAFPAEAVLAAYHARWGIEKVFHQITDVFSLKHLIGTGPKAALYQMAFCLLLYNALQVVRLHLASHQACAAETISNEKLFDDVRRQLISVDELIEVDLLLGLLGTVPSADELRSQLHERLDGVWTKRWRKAPSSGGSGHNKPKKRVLGNHTSTYRVLQQARE